MKSSQEPDASFASLLSGGTSASSNGTGGVTVSSKQNVGAQGLLTTSTTSTNMAISGSGFFVVSPGTDSKEIAYTRNGEFGVDDEGYLVNNGYYLMGWPTDADGNVTGSASTSTLQAIDTDAIATIASATTTASMIANLPAEAEVGATFTSSMEVYDSLGTAGTAAGRRARRIRRSRLIWVRPARRLVSANMLAARRPWRSSCRVRRMAWALGR